ncbi:RNA ligase family protein [Thioclava sp. DLFJ4-1]|uniref:RNA ligase family protein n=1 Tax=Thioclava sp. DLFJ4-1 TaxID=1915313 RepID=UPI0009981B50|nr:RNA ligase family protein [Thioclava sp. DLFJ4-1]OOY15866.1 DNA ligase [Thioclava sp. DLFJ4-1]
MNEFFRFPHTPHLVWLGSGNPRGDKVLSQNQVGELLSGEVIVEEKIDGANLGISRGEDGEIWLQNRGSYLSPPYRGQFTRIASWLGEREEGLSSVLSSEKILFGEWCAAKHSLLYDRLPDWFLLFDVYCRSKKQFLSTAQRNAIARSGGLSTVPEIARGRFTLGQLTDLLLNEESQVRAGSMEGIIIRSEGDALSSARAKLVRPDFTQAIHEHWSSRPLSWNRLA